MLMTRWVITLKYQCLHVNPILDGPFFASSPIAYLPSPYLLGYRRVSVAPEDTWVAVFRVREYRSVEVDESPLTISLVLGPPHEVLRVVGVEVGDHQCEKNCFVCQPALDESAGSLPPLPDRSGTQRYAVDSWVSPASTVMLRSTA